METVSDELRTPVRHRHGVRLRYRQGHSGALAKDSMDVGITWHSDSDGAEATAEEVRAAGQKAYVAQLDTSDLPSCGDVADQLAEQLGGLDVFVNNAGMGASQLLLDTSYDDWRKIVAVDLDGAFVCLQRRPSDG